MPKVPQAVPVENERAAAMMNIIAGIRATGMDEASTRAATYTPVLSRSRQMPLMVQARVKMMIAGVMDLTPAPKAAKKSLKPISRRGTKRRKATTRAPKPPRARAKPAEVSPKASKSVLSPPAQKPPYQSMASTEKITRKATGIIKSNTLPLAETESRSSSLLSPKGRPSPASPAPVSPGKPAASARRCAAAMGP